MSNVTPYGSAIAEHFRRPRNYGAMPNATATAEGVNPLCGDRVRIAIQLDTDDVVTDARFTANACAICVASASLLTERVRGRPRAEAAQISDDEMLALVGDGVPAARRKCATLPLDALRRAVASRLADQSSRVVAAVLLAAGSARRFDGTQKLLAQVPSGHGTVPLVRRSTAALVDAGIRHIVIVLGRDAEQVRQSLDGFPVVFAVNAEYASGLSSSLRTGVSEAMRRWPNADGLLVALGDQPLAETGVLETILARTADARRVIVAPRFLGEIGNPVLFDRAIVGELLQVTGDRGARVLVERDPSRVQYVDFDRAMPVDVDTVSDLAILRGTSTPS